jgi:hypothetical protein
MVQGVLSPKEKSFWISSSHNILISSAFIFRGRCYFSIQREYCVQAEDLSSSLHTNSPGGVEDPKQIVFLQYSLY